MKHVEIGNKIIGDGQPCYIIAEAGCNHNQDIEIAKKLIDMSVLANADAVKFQSYHAENIYSKQTPMMKHFKERLNSSKSATMFDLIKATELPWNFHPNLVNYCKSNNIPFLSTPFELGAVDLLESFDVPAYKIAAFEMTFYPLLKKVAQTGKPIILSTGMSNLGDIEKAVSCISNENNDQIILLHCVSNYPAKPEDYNLRVMNTLKSAFGCPVGLSDHTPGIELPKIAFALGADMIEKHITINQSLPGPDHYFSLLPDELSALVKNRDEIELILGSPEKKCTDSEQIMKKNGRRSLIASCDICKGDKITKDMIAIKRPGTGLHPELFDYLVGSVAQRNIDEDSPLEWNMFIDYAD